MWSEAESKLESRAYRWSQLLALGHQNSFSSVDGRAVAFLCTISFDVASLDPVSEALILAMI